MSARHVTADGPDPRDRYVLYRLCECPSCAGTGKVADPLGCECDVLGLPLEAECVRDEPCPAGSSRQVKCPDCRGEGRTRQEIATCATPEALGVALVTLGREGEWEGCPIGILDTEGETGEKWLVRPWLPSTRNVSDAAKLLRAQQ